MVRKKNDIKVLALETSADDTCGAVVEGCKVLSNVISSQIDIHKEWGGIVPNLAKRAHEERIGLVVDEALRRARVNIEKIDAIAVSLGPGLGVALAAGVNKAKELAVKYQKPLVGVNHVEGHLGSIMLQNREGKPAREVKFPLLCLTVSGGHTKIVLTRGWGQYEVVGETLDDAAGEALDKAAKMMGLGYPGGPVIERLALKGNPSFIELPLPLNVNKILNYSFSGLKTSFYYQVKKMDKKEIEKHLADLAASYQRAIFDHLEKKYKLAAEKYQPKMLSATGGVLANDNLRKRLRKVAKQLELNIYYPAKKIYNTDNAAMIGLVGGMKAQRREFIDPQEADIRPNWEIV